jgi:uncharacterized protein (DUF58 family)
VPTREGTAVLLLAAAIFLLATNLMSGLLFVLDALLVSLLLVGVGASLLPLRGISVVRDAPDRGVEGTPVPIEVTVTAAHGGRFLIVEDGGPGARARALVPQVSAGRPVSLPLQVAAVRRGRHALGPVEVTSKGILGLFTSRRRFTAPQTVTIWPRIRPVTPQVLAHLAPALDAHAARRTHLAEDLYGVRDFQPGDSIARIHWRSSARRGSLVVREFERPVAAAATIVLDLDRRQAPERLDAAVRAAASVLQAALERRAEVVLVGWEETRVEHRQWEAAMDWLAGVVPSGPPLTEVLAALEGAGRQVVAIASSAAAGFGPGVLPIVPADDVALRSGTTGGLVYTSDGTVQAW